MYYEDFVALIRRNANPATCLDFHKTRFGPQDIITILDFQLPRRQGIECTGHSHEDWYRDSVVCNSTWHNGEIPLFSQDGLWKQASPDNPLGSGWIKRPAVGVIDVLVQLVGQGVVVPTHEIRKYDRDALERAPGYTKLLEGGYG